jgi:hypothetical protein
MSMVETIAPVVHGERKRPYFQTLGLHTVGATASAALVGAIAGGIGALVGAPWGRSGLLLVVALGAAYGCRELFAWPVPLPERKAQVPDWWRTFYSPATAALMYGAGLGAGFLTHLTYGTPVVVGALAFVSGGPATGALLLAPFGLARGLSIAINATGRDPADIVCRLEQVATSRLPRLANGLALVCIGSALAHSLA